MDKCNHCICKTCAIAYVNGGAPGCGDCIKCIANDFDLQCKSCNDYYNSSPISVSQFYLINKADESQD